MGIFVRVPVIGVSPRETLSSDLGLIDVESDFLEVK
jgi:hypothetical protein